MELNRNRGDDGGQFFAHDGQVLALPHFLTQCTLELVCIFEHVFNGAVFCQELCCSLFTHTRDARNIVYRIAHHGKDVNYLRHLFDVPFFTDLFGANDFKISALVGWFEYLDVVRNQLSIILVGGNHVDLVACFFCLFGKGADDIIRLKSIGLQNRNVQAFDDFLDIGDRSQQVFRSLLPVCFVFGIICMSFSWGGSIETYCQVGGLLLIEQVNQCVGETKLCVGVFSFAGDARASDQCIIGTKDQRKCIEKEQLFFHGPKLLFSAPVSLLSVRDASAFHVDKIRQHFSPGRPVVVDVCSPDLKVVRNGFAVQDV